MKESMTLKRNNMKRMKMKKGVKRKRAVLLLAGFMVTMVEGKGNGYLGRIE